jgi:hypothetical protein
MQSSPAHSFFQCGTIDSMSCISEMQTLHKFTYFLEPTLVGTCCSQALAADSVGVLIAARGESVAFSLTHAHAINMYMCIYIRANVKALCGSHVVHVQQCIPSKFAAKIFKHTSRRIAGSQAASCDRLWCECYWEHLLARCRRVSRTS